MPAKKKEKKKVDNPFGKRMMSVPEVAAYIGMSPRTLYDQTAPKARKRFPVKPKRIGGLVRFDRTDIDQWLDSL